ncbi:MAG: sulfatase [Prolixibacteraceae bacterium]|jgi:uncharacterized sulfatase|nr:sulfatase [Prolixibacteraceae bacterium]
MKSVLHAILFLLSLSATTGVANDPKKKMNVLFISVDDMNNDLGCYGNTLVKSPNIDRLASRGIAFSNSYCQFPLCNPSRSSVLTGMRPDRTRVFDLNYHFRQEIPDVVTLPQMFINNGYFVARVGKMYHYANPGHIGTNGLDDRASWMERINPVGIDRSSLEPDLINYTPDRGLGTAMSFLSDRKGKDEDHTDGKVATEVIKLLEQHMDKPFFIGAGFYKPHCPWIAPEKYFDLYRIDDMKLPEISDETPSNYPEQSLAGTIPWPYFGINPDNARECKLAYFATISYIDSQIGRLLEAIDSLGLANNTIIVLWSDHGYHLGEHGLWHKRSCFEESAKCPLIISVPGLKSNGKICQRIVELIDIYPTLAELTNISTPETVDGRSLLPLLNNPDVKWKYPAFTQFQGEDISGHSVRTERWRYTEWDYGNSGIELYDQKKDQQELKNLAHNPKYASVVKQMKASLKKNHPELVSGGKAIANTKEKYSN